MRWWLVVSLVAVTACTAAQQDTLAQDAAKRAVRPVLAERFPGVPVEPAVDCVIENATAQEILSLASDAVIGPTASTVEITTRIVSRPATIRCLAEDGLPVLIEGL
ncbi:MAG: hypothetical protein AAF762_12845 [Pseudomonadota bacterium]